MSDEVLDNIDFTGGVQPKPLNLIQKAIKKSKEPLKDGIIYDGVLVKVESFDTKKGTPVLSYVYDVSGVEVSDMYFFSTYAIENSVKRLMKTLEKFDFELNLQTANEGVESLRYFTKCLVGSEVKLVQTTRVAGENSYPNYEIVSVTKKITEED